MTQLESITYTVSIDTVHTIKVENLNKRQPRYDLQLATDSFKYASACV